MTRINRDKEGVFEIRSGRLKVDKCIKVIPNASRFGTLRKFDAPFLSFR